MLRRKNDNKYIETYHIDSKEGLIIFLTELKDYYARKQGLRETEVQRYDEIISTVSSEILKQVNPSITNYDWMRADEQYGEIFLNTILLVINKFLLDVLLEKSLINLIEQLTLI